jgi:hypothetical protein
MHYTPPEHIFSAEIPLSEFVSCEADYFRHHAM